MADQPLGSPTALRSIHVELAVHNMMHNGAINGRASAAWPTANRIVYVPVRCPGHIRVTKLAFNNGTVVSGNIDVGIYSSTGQLIVSSGSTAQAGTSAYQEFNVTDTDLAPGWYYLAGVLDNGTGTSLRLATTILAKRTYGIVEETTFPLPASATFSAVVTGQQIPTIVAFGTSVF